MQPATLCVVPPLHVRLIVPPTVATVHAPSHVMAQVPEVHAGDLGAG